MKVCVCVCIHFVISDLTELILVKQYTLFSLFFCLAVSEKSICDFVESFLFYLNFSVLLITVFAFYL